MGMSEGAVASAKAARPPRRAESTIAATESARSPIEGLLRANMPFTRHQKAGIMLSLASFEPLLGLVNNVYSAFPTNKTIVAMSVAQGFERITDFHGAPLFREGRADRCILMVSVLCLRSLNLSTALPRSLHAVPVY